MKSQGIHERQGDLEEALRTLSDYINSNLRVAMPGIIKSFNPTEQTAEVTVAIRERVTDENKNINFVEIPTLLDVPIVMPRGGGYAITFPIKPGDECLVVFSDLCINAWWSLGGVQNIEEYRRHDFSDAIAILSPTSQPKRLNNYYTGGLELRNENGDSYIRLKDNEDIDIRGRYVNIQQWGP